MTMTMTSLWEPFMTLNYVFIKPFDAIRTFDAFSALGSEGPSALMEKLPVSVKIFFAIMAFFTAVYLLTQVILYLVLFCKRIKSKYFEDYRTGYWIKALFLFVLLLVTGAGTALIVLSSQDSIIGSPADHPITNLNFSGVLETSWTNLQASVERTKLAVNEDQRLNEARLNDPSWAAYREALTNAYYIDLAFENVLSEIDPSVMTAFRVDNEKILQVSSSIMQVEVLAAMAVAGVITLLSFVMMLLVWGRKGGIFIAILWSMLLTIMAVLFVASTGTGFAAPLLKDLSQVIDANSTNIPSDLMIGSVNASAISDSVRQCATGVPFHELAFDMACYTKHLQCEETPGGRVYKLLVEPGKAVQLFPQNFIRLSPQSSVPINDTDGSIAREIQARERWLSEAFDCRGVYESVSIPMVISKSLANAMSLQFAGFMLLLVSQVFIVALGVYFGRAIRSFRYY